MNAAIDQAKQNAKELREIVSGLSPDEQSKVGSAATRIVAIINEAPDLGVVALAVVGIQIQAQIACAELTGETEGIFKK